MLANHHRMASRRVTMVWALAAIGLVCLSSAAGVEKPPQEAVQKKESASTPSRQVAKATRPNILFIITDDQSPLDLKVYDPKSQLQTPNIDRLAREGMVFDEAYHMGAFISAVCTPSRHMIKCGRTLWHLPIAPEANKYCPPNLEQDTIAAVFNRGGYDSMRTGKPGNSYEAAKRQFTVRKDSVGRSGVAPEGSAWHADRVLEYLEQREAANDRDPFLIYFGFSHPHDPRNGTPELLAKYGATNHDDPNSLPAANPKQPPLPPNYLPGHPFNTTLHPDQRDETNVSGVWKNRDERTIRNERGRYFACCENIDLQIGRVLQKLEALDELDNTYVFFTSDHGIAIGRHGLQGKQNLYQHSWRVPFIVKGPGVKPGSRVKGNIYLLDCLATLCDIASIAPPETNEGISFRPILEGQRESIRDCLYGVHCGGTKPGMRCVKKGDWKLIKYDGAEGAVRETQLFNLQENPDELVHEHHDPRVAALTGSTPARHQLNLAKDPRYAEKLKEMEKLLLAEMRRLHDPWRLWDQPADGLKPPIEEPAAKRPRGEPAAKLAFRHHYIDRDLPGASYGQTCLVDLDQDGDLDFITGGKGPDLSIFWFEFQSPDSWDRHVLGTRHPSDVGGTSIDVDGDGWLDHVTGGVWYRNTGRPRSEAFERIVFDSELAAVHDLVPADLDGDGRLEVITMSDKNNLRWYRIPKNFREPWEKHDIAAGVHAGVAVGDIDGDGDVDVARSNAWFENRDAKGLKWMEHAIPFGNPKPPYPLATRCVIADINQDGKNDLVMTENEIRAGKIAWLENAGQGTSWRVHELPAGDEAPRGAYHSLAVADFDQDTDLDVFTVEMEAIPGARQPRWYIWENVDGKGRRLVERVILDAGLGGHEAVVADVDGDGDLDIASKLWRPRRDNSNGGRNHADFLQNLLRRK